MWSIEIDLTFNEAIIVVVVVVIVVIDVVLVYGLVYVVVSDLVLYMVNSCVKRGSYECCSF